MEPEEEPNVAAAREVCEEVGSDSVFLLLDSTFACLSSNQQMCSLAIPV